MHLTIACCFFSVEHSLTCLQYCHLMLSIIDVLHFSTVVHRIGINRQDGHVGCSHSWGLPRSVHRSCQCGVLHTTHGATIEFFFLRLWSYRRLSPSSLASVRRYFFFF